ncbi:hypothetical protein ACWDSD_36430 [Streptomyces spiralis]
MTEDRNEKPGSVVYAIVELAVVLRDDRGWAASCSASRARCLAHFR